MSTRCQHPRLHVAFTFSDGSMIRGCPDCHAFDKERSEVLRTPMISKPKTVTEMETQLGARLADYLVWKYFNDFEPEKGDTFKRLVAYCYGAVCKHKPPLYIKPRAYEQYVETTLEEQAAPSDILYRQARHRETEETIVMALAKFLASFEKLTPEERNLKHMKGEFGLVVVAVFRDIQDEIDKRRTKKQTVDQCEHCGENFGSVADPTDPKVRYCVVCLGQGIKDCRIVRREPTYIYGDEEVQTEDGETVTRFEQIG